MVKEHDTLIFSGIGPYSNVALSAAGKPSVELHELRVVVKSVLLAEV
tara:strand:+ start:1621 stop:1761 length:141 start_codon:yes stop_codon:yes gene_type:complete